MFVLNPDPYSLPCYRIGPFMTTDLAKNHNLPDSKLVDGYLHDRFTGKEFIYTYNGRRAIHLALGYLDLKKDDVVTILTTSGNFYISGCVTSEIEKYCKWSRDFLPETKAIFVNHEFGYPYENLSSLKKHGLPIIEDCAASFFSADDLNETGNVGDFVIYSFPKMFPVQIGGLLVSNTRSFKLNDDKQINQSELNHVRNVLSSQIGQKDQIIQKRLINYRYLKERFLEIGYDVRFPLKAGAVPGVFMFKTGGSNIDLPDLKKHFYAHGVQCSVFYGEEAFFIPVHQALNNDDMDYFVTIFKSFIENHNLKRK